MFWALLPCILDWGLNGLYFYFAWRSTVKMITFISKVSYDFSKKRNIRNIPMIIYENYY